MAKPSASEILKAVRIIDDSLTKIEKTLEKLEGSKEALMLTQATLELLKVRDKLMRWASEKTKADAEKVLDRAEETFIGKAQKIPPEIPTDGISRPGF